jgi:hypothetical protein
VAADHRPRTDRDAVVATTQDYIEGYYTGDAERMERSLHPSYIKKTLSESFGQQELTDKSGLTMVQTARSGEGRGIPKERQTEDITVLDITRNTASVKLVAADWTDYVNLVKWHGEWKIVSVLLSEN